MGDDGPAFVPRLLVGVAELWLEFSTELFDRSGIRACKQRGERRVVIG